VLAAVAILVLEKEASIEFFKQVQRPIDFHQPMQEFFDDILLLMATATRMPFIALREEEDEGRALRCIAQYGFPVEPSVLDLEPLTEFPTFLRAFRERKTIIEPAMDQEHLQNLRARPELKDVQSFVVTPVLVGTRTFGTLSFAASCRYSYSNLEVSAFESLANAVGTSVTNYRNAQRVGEIFTENAKLSVSITALEVAQSARHEARGRIEDAQALLALARTLAGKPKEREQELKEKLNDIGASLQEIAKAMDKIRDVSKLPARTLAKVSVKQVWQEAIAIVSGKLTTGRVACAPPDKDADIEAYADLLRHAFLNLLLNSIDAFENKVARRGRRIDVTIEPRLEARDIRIRYSDNAGGIDPSKLTVPSEIDGALPLERLIFEPGVTSKEGGSGYGLFLVRRILDQHKGSIDLIDHRAGVVFEIALPKHLSQM
jgi:signal transduction histidine kinase